MRLKTSHLSNLNVKASISESSTFHEVSACLFVFQGASSPNLSLLIKKCCPICISMKYLFEDDVNVACNQLGYLLSLSGLY